MTNLSSFLSGSYVGYVGSQGDIGYTGSQGNIGYTGSKGDIGYTGSKGDIGYTGSQGNIGYTGSKGDIGYTGSKGDLGYTGSKGDLGYTGSKGDIGYTGSGAGSINELSDGYTTLGNIGLGLNVLNAYNTTSNENVVVGDNAARNLSMSFGTSNQGCSVVIGHESLCWAVYAGSTVAIGKRAMFNSGSTQKNVVIGYNAGYNPDDIDPGGGPGQITATQNVFVGACSGGSQGLGNNTAVGYASASKLCYDGDTLWNTALGAFSLQNLTIANGNTGLGYSTLKNTTTGLSNTAVGQNALISNLTGSNNIAVGKNSAFYTTSANDVIAIGTCALYCNNTNTNIGIGLNAGKGLTSASGVIAIGPNALSTTSSGTGTIAIGENAILSGGGADGNIAIGQGAACCLNSAPYNIAIGQNAMRNNGLLSGDGVNVAIGPEALYAATTGGYNIAIGWQTGPRYDAGGYTNNVMIGAAAGTKLCGVSTSNTYVGHATGSNPFATKYQRSCVIAIGDSATTYGSDSLSIHIGNSAGCVNAAGNTISLGHFALKSNTTGSFNIAIGNCSLCSNTEGCYNISIGYRAMRDSIGNASQSSSIALGHDAILLNTRPSDLIAIGRLAMSGSTCGTSSVAVGHRALCKNATFHNVGVGNDALGANTTGQFNTAVGNLSLRNTVGTGAEASHNVAVGHMGLCANTTGAGNTAVGSNVAKTLTTGSNNIVIGYGAEPSSATASSEITLGNTYISLLRIPGLGSTNGHVLQYNSTSGGIVLGAVPNPLLLYAENPSSPTAPSATGTNAVAIGTGAIADKPQAIAFGSLATAQQDRGLALGYDAEVSGAGRYGGVAISAYNLGPGARTTHSGAVSIGEGSLAGANESIALGKGATTTGVTAVALGDSRAAGADSLAAAIANNTSSYGATGTNSIAMGLNAKAAGQESTTIGGKFSIANAFGSIALGHSEANGTASIGLGASSGNYRGNAGGTGAIAIGWGRAAASNPVASAEGSVALQHGRSLQKGKFAFTYDATGDNAVTQTGIFVLRANTTNANAIALTTNNTTASTDNQIILPNNSAYFFSGTCVARESAASGTDMGAWEFKGCIRREANAGTTTLVSSTIDEFSAPTDWSIALSADTTNGGLAVTVTGVASTNIRWVATVHTSEVTYA